MYYYFLSEKMLTSNKIWIKIFQLNSEKNFSLAILQWTSKKPPTRTLINVQLNLKSLQNVLIQILVASIIRKTLYYLSNSMILFSIDTIIHEKYFSVMHKDYIVHNHPMSIPYIHQYICRWDVVICSTLYNVLNINMHSLKAILETALQHKLFIFKYVHNFSSAPSIHHSSQSCHLRSSI